MTADRNFDRTIAGWLDERAVTQVPDRLLARSLARIDRTRQRPEWLVAQRTLRLPGQTRVLAVPAWAILLLVALVSGAIVATGARLVIRPQPVVLVQATNAIESSTVIESPTPTTVENRRLPFLATATTFATLRELVPASEQVAWALTREGILRTDDTGRTWRAVEPRDWSPAESAGFVDVTTAYVASGGHPATIEVTHDGGSSWAATTVHPGMRVTAPVFSLRNASHGYATFVDPAIDAASSGAGLVIFETTDGGATWQGPVRGVVPRVPGSTNQLYPAKGGFLVQSAIGDGDLVGLSERTYPLRDYHFENWFALSDDGGLTWVRNDFPADLPAAEFKAIDDVFREDGGRLLISVRTDDEQGFEEQRLYESSDGSSDWRLILLEPRGYDVQFLSSTTWVAASTYSNEIRSTTDGGASWSVVTASAPPFRFENHDLKQFANVRTGWASIECPAVTGRACGDKNPYGIHALFVSQDGGATWSEVGR